jgi:hypothetical protein
MKNIKLFIGLFLVFFAMSCSKDSGTTAVDPVTQDVAFNVTNVAPQVAGKNAIAGKTAVAIPDCSDSEPAYAIITIDGDEYQTDVSRLDGKLITQSIKLDAGEGTVTYSVSEFLLYDVNDNLIMATPTTGSDYAEYVNNSVAFDIVVTAFEKAEIPIEVLCFTPQAYANFGFTWFASTEITVREVCFFGDICLNGEPFAPADFNGSSYGENVGADVTASMQIIVKKGGIEVPNSPFENLNALNSPLCVQYPDNLNVDSEVFTFELQLWLPDGNGFSYQTYATYTATDDGALNVAPGNDGVLDFVVGTCGYEGADQTFDFLYPAPTCVETDLLTGSVAAESSSTENLNLAGAAWSVVLNADCSVTFCLTPTLFDGSPLLKALTIGIRTEAEAIADAGGIDLTYGSSDGTSPDDELVSTDGGVTYCYTAPAGSLPSGEVGIFFMVNGRAPDDGNDLQRWIGMTSMTSANDWGGFDWSWANRFKITLP